MTIEEKAKAYDNVVNKLRRFMEHGIDPLITRTDVQDFFPELAESDDERIRKAIITFFESEDDNTTYALVPKKDILAWLEKQGNVNALIQEAAEKSYTEGMRVERKRWIEKQGEQKPKWSENDEHHWMMCVACVEECATQEREDFSKTIDWLKSLKQRLEVKQDESR